MPPRQRIAHVPKHKEHITEVITQNLHEEYQPEPMPKNCPLYKPKRVLKIIPAKPLRTAEESLPTHSKNFVCGIPIDVTPKKIAEKQIIEATRTNIDRAKVVENIKQRIINQQIAKEASCTKIPKTTIQDLERICGLKQESSISNTRKRTHRRGRQHRNRRLQAQLWPIIQANTLSFQQSQPIINKLYTLQGELNTMRLESKSASNYQENEIF